ncbi:MAG: 3-dehydroquinate synthase [Pirellulales bacterium]
MRVESDAGERVEVCLRERSYTIAIGPGLLAETARQIGHLPSIAHAVVITDTTVEGLYARQVADLLRSIVQRVDLLVVPAGEPSKSVQQAARLWQEMLDRRADRKSLVVAVGGGVVGDLAGFIAATFARGVPLWQVPTTLLAQVDSSVGGKVGINLPQAKNIVGAFWQPVGVLIDPEVLATLDDRQYRAGLAEVVKYGVILDADFFAYLEAHTDRICQRDSSVLEHVIARCCRLKADVVEQDEREETGHRAVLNYGHTFCHALEAASGYGQLLHGEAVAIGMLCASRLAERMGRIPVEVTRRQRDLITALGLSVQMPDLPRQQLVDLMRHDKKVERGELRFVLPTRLGHVELVDRVDPRDVLAALEDQGCSE